jgi:hypothetical protein
MAEQKFYTPLKIGIMVVVIAYFLFTLHSMFTLSWIGEWNRMGGGDAFGRMILIEDISATIGLVFRFAASIIALAAITAYFMQKNLSKPKVYNVLRVVLVFEGIYWLGLIATAYYSVQNFWMFLHGGFLTLTLESLFLGAIPTVAEALVLPIMLFIFAYKLNPNKPFRTSVKWASITSTIFILVFWLTNTSSWVGVLLERGKGIGYLLSETVQVNGAQHLVYHPEHLVSFITTVFGLLALAIYTGYFTIKSRGTQTLEELKLGSVGVIILGFGMFFLWNYLSWVILAGNTWNDWYAWFLGHNMDLWMLTLPLAALPLLFQKKTPEQTSSNTADSEKDVR